MPVTKRLRPDAANFRKSTPDVLLSATMASVLPGRAPYPLAGRAKR